MNVQRAAGALLILLPFAFNVFFFLLARKFNYPDILRSPIGDIMLRFQEGGAFRLRKATVCGPFSAVRDASGHEPCSGVHRTPAS